MRFSQYFREKQKDLQIMKRLFFVLLIAIVVSMNVNAQKMSFGIVANPQISWMKPDGTKVDQAGTKLGLSFGLNSDFFFADNYAIHTGLLINNTGGRLEYNDDIDFITADSTFNIASGSPLKYNLQYINIPFGLKFKTKQLGYFTYFGQIGVDGFVRISARGESKDYDINDAGISDEIALFNAGYHIGGGMEYSLGGSTAIMAGFKYSKGFIDVTTDKNKEDDKTFLNSVVLQIGILF